MIHLFYLFLVPYQPQSSRACHLNEHFCFNAAFIPFDLATNFLFEMQIST